MRVRIAVAFAFAITALIAPVAHAQEDRWERQVRGQLERAAASLSPRGSATSRAAHVGMLDTDESETVTLRLHAGTSYVVVGSCDGDCSQLGLVLSDVTSHDLAADRASDNAPVVRVTPRETAAYRVKAIMASCRVNPCRYGIAVITLPAP